MTHPTPSAMAREAYPSAPDDSADPGGWFTSATRATYAAGIAAERARIAAWLREEANAPCVSGRATVHRLAEQLAAVLR